MNSASRSARVVRATQPVPVSTEAIRSIAWPLALPAVRVLLVAVSAAIIWALLATTGQAIGYSAISQYSALALAPVNVICLLLLRRLVHREGRTLRELAGLERNRIGRDAAWGLLWLMVLYLPFALAVIGTMFAMYGADAFTSFERVFVPEATIALPQTVAIMLGALTVLTFAPLNAPTEELVFRGYAQGQLAQAGRGRAWPTVFAVAVPAAIFGLQHAFFAPTLEGALVYIVAFFVWGLGSGIIYLRQRRLAPLIYCHLAVNLFTSLPALFVPFALGA